MIIGCGFSGMEIAKLAWEQGMTVIGTKRPKTLERLTQAPRGVMLSPFDAETSSSESLWEMLQTTSHLLISIAPDVGDGDLLLHHHRNVILNWLKGDQARWVGYLSTTGIYGNHDGAWVDEQTPPKPTMNRTIMRLETEQAWQAIIADSGSNANLTLFRLAGIYGKGRNALESLTNGQKRRIFKAGQFFSRIHHHDIARFVCASIKQTDDAEGGPSGAIKLYNLADDLPAPPHEVIDYAAKLLNMELPPMMDFETASLTPMQRSFYNDNKRIKNDLIKQELGIDLKFPTYRDALDQLLKDYR